MFWKTRKKLLQESIIDVAREKGAGNLPGGRTAKLNAEGVKRRLIELIVTHKMEVGEEMGDSSWVAGGWAGNIVFGQFLNSQNV